MWYALTLIFQNTNCGLTKVPRSWNNRAWNILIFIAYTIIVYCAWFALFGYEFVIHIHTYTLRYIIFNKPIISNNFNKPTLKCYTYITTWSWFVKITYTTTWKMELQYIVTDTNASCSKFYNEHFLANKSIRNKLSV